MAPLGHLLASPLCSYLVAFASYQRRVLVETPAVQTLVTPPASWGNLIVPAQVSNYDKHLHRLPEEATVVLRQTEVELRRFVPSLQNRLKDLHTRSAKSEFRPLGFFVLVRRNGEAYEQLKVLGESDPRGVRADEAEKEIFKIVKMITPEVTRIQFFHTHPNTDGALNMSAADLRVLEKWASILNSQDIFLPIDMYAMPAQMMRVGVEIPSFAGRQRRGLPIRREVLKHERVIRVTWPAEGVFQSD